NLPAECGYAVSSAGHRREERHFIVLGNCGIEIDVLLVDRRTQPRCIAERFEKTAAALLQVVNQIAHRFDAGRKLHDFLCRAHLLPYPGKIEQRHTGSPWVARAGRTWANPARK